MSLLGIRDALVLSPMVDVTDAAFRSVAKEWGADITCSEMASAAGLVHDNPTSWKLVQPWPRGESPYGVQLMSGKAEEMAEAVERVNEAVRPDFIDLNLGCPSPNILRSCAGGFLLRDPKNAGRVIAAAVDAAGTTPVTVKMRLGHDHDHLTYLDVGEEAEAAGAAWCTLHGRTVEQMYSGQADWKAIGKLVDHLGIPVVGNGDIRGPEDVVRMRDETGCHGYFIARAAMHDPTIFRRLREALDGQTPSESPAIEARIETFLQYVDRAGVIGADDLGNLRRQGTRFMSGVPGAKAIRKSLHDATSVEDIRTALGAVQQAHA